MHDASKPDRTSILSRAARAHVREGRMEQAQSLIGAWHQREPDRAIVQALQSLVALTRGDVDGARILVTQAISKDSGCALAFLALGHLYGAEARGEDAIVAFERASALAPHDGEIRGVLAQAHLQRGDIGTAQRLLRDALRDEPESAPIRLALADLLLTHGASTLDVALDLVRGVCESTPHLDAAWGLYGRVLAAMGDLQGARDRIELALELHPDEVAYLLQLAHLHLQETAPTSENLATALRLARRANALAPHEWRGAVVVARVLKRQGAWSSALRFLAETAQAFPKQSEVQFEFASLCGEIGQVDAAFQALEIARREGHPTSDVETLRVGLLMQRGDLIEASAAFDALEAPAGPSDRPRMPSLAALEGIEGSASVAFVPGGLAQCLLLVRYAAALGGAGLCVDIVAPDFLATLLGRVAGVRRVSSEPGDARWVEPMMRIPALLGATGLPGPLTVPYLMADPARVARLRQHRGGSEAPCVVVDLTGLPDSPWLTDFGAWLARRDAQIVVLSQEIPAWLPSSVRCVPVDMDDIETLAAWMTCARAVVCTDVPLAHLAGGLGVDADVLLRLGHEPCWGMDADRCAFYPSLRFHRERLDHGWESAWVRLRADLDARLASNAEGPSQEAVRDARP